MGLAAEECYTKKISLCVSKLTQGAARFVLIGADVVPADRIEEKKNRKEGENGYFIPLARRHPILSTFNHKLRHGGGVNEAENTSQEAFTNGVPLLTCKDAGLRVPDLNPLTHTHTR